MFKLPQVECLPSLCLVEIYRNLWWEGSSLENQSLVIVAQPTWGVDAGSANNIHQSLISLADQGSAVLIISQDLDEIFKSMWNKFMSFQRVVFQMQSI